MIDLVYFKLTTGGIYINPDKIYFVKRSANNPDSTSIDFGNGNWGMVEEPIDIVLAKLQKNDCACIIKEENDND